MTAPLTNDVKGLAGLFAASGIIHLVRPQTYEPMMPKVIPRKREIILGSGVVELACAAGLLHPRTRRLAGFASVGLLLAVYPANIKMANDAAKTRSTGLKAAALGRLPLQLPMIRAAWKATR